MSVREWGGVYFILDGSEYAFRSWTKVPRVGDTVVFSSTDEPFEVLRVLWREERSPPNRPYVEAIIKRR